MDGRDLTECSCSLCFYPTGMAPPILELGGRASRRRSERWVNLVGIDERDRGGILRGLVDLIGESRTKQPRGSGELIAREPDVDARREMG